MKMKKNYHRIFAMIMVTAILLTGCKAENRETSSDALTKPAVTTAPAITATVTDVPATRIFTDSCGREVELPAKINKIAPSGSLAQIVIYSIAPDKLAGLAFEFDDNAKPYIDEKYYNLPTFGQFYGKSNTLNLEALAAAAPDVIIDIGDAKDTVKEDMDSIQEQTGIPAIHIEATLETIADAYLTLGDLLSEEEQGQKLSEYCKETIADAKEKAASIPEMDRVTVYYGETQTGLATDAKGSIHADVIDMVGAVNVADIEETSGAGMEEISLEQIMLWNPDVMIFAPDSIYDTVESDSSWKDFQAIKSGKVYKIPMGPYNWMGRPPAVNRLIGIKWLGNLLYPDVFNYDMVSETKNFYQLFYHYELTDDQVKELLSDSTYKSK